MAAGETKAVPAKAAAVLKRGTNCRRMIICLCLFAFAVTNTVPAVAVTDKSFVSPPSVIKSKKQAGKFLYSCFLDRKKYISFDIKASASSNEKKFISDICDNYAYTDARDNNLKDFYYFNTCRELNFGYIILRDPLSGRKVMRFYIKAVYVSTKKQEKAALRMAKQTARKLHLYNKQSKYKKLRKIYRYVIQRIKKYDINCPLAYTGFVKRRASCVGYSAMVFLLCREAKIPCRIIDNVEHAWNIVKIGGKWYNLDATWDDGNSRWMFFLKGNRHFRGHGHLKKRYLTRAFRRTHRISKGDYKAR